MIKFDKLFIILKNRGIGQVKFCSEFGVSKGQLDRLRQNKNVETYTLNKIMNMLELDSLDDICTFVKDEKDIL